MAKDNAVQNQKVFVPLAAVLDLQERYLRTVSIVERDRSQNLPCQLQIERKRSFEEVIDLLGLPINKKS
jgi:hypothetical protein